jgi:glycosyltransferase involved in cell wall biosynthesis
VYVHGDALLASKVARQRPTLLYLPGPVTADIEPELRSAHAICAHGDALACIRQFLGDDAIELPNGLDDQRFMPGPTTVRSDLGWTEQHQVIGYVGRLTHLKGADLLAAAFHEVAQNAPEARFLIVGTGEADKQTRATLAAEIGRGVVHIEPGVEHERLPEWYRALDAIVIPSRYENFSNAILEAMACGVPCLASDIGGNRVLVGSGAGWLFAPNSISALKRCLLRVLECPAEIKARGRFGASLVRGRYSWTATAQRLESIISEYLGVKE